MVAISTGFGPPRKKGIAISGFSLTDILDLITENAAIAGPIIGLVTLAESTVIIGMFIPAVAMMMALGGLVAAGALDPAPVLFWALAGSVLGDWISYLLGKQVGHSVYHRWPLRNHRPSVAQARLFFRRYGVASVFLARFFGPVRATIPLVAGVMRMPGRSFQLANFTSAAVWVPALLAPGYLAGETLSLETMSNWTLAGIGIALLVIPLGIAALAMRLAMGRNVAASRR